MPSEIRKRRFCSPACCGQSRKGKTTVPKAEMACLECGKTFKTHRAWVKSGRRKFCTRKCKDRANTRNKNRLGVPHTDEARQKMRDAATGKYLRENSSQWKGGTYLAKGYRHVMVEMLPEPQKSLARQMTKGRYILEHRAVAAEKLGRPLRRNEIVHHMNGVKDDNRPDNLEVVGRGQHTKEHREVEKELLRLRVENQRLQDENHVLKSRLAECRKGGSATLCS